LLLVAMHANESERAALACANPGSIADHGIDDVTEHYAKIIDGLPAKPILVGHSFGGMIAEKLLGEDYGAAATGNRRHADQGRAAAAPCPR
jgi:hypothetical protein